MWISLLIICLPSSHGVAPPWCLPQYSIQLEPWECWEINSVSCGHTSLTFLGLPRQILLTLPTIKHLSSSTVSYQHQLIGIYHYWALSGTLGHRLFLLCFFIFLGVGAHSIFSVKVCGIQLNFPSKWYGSLGPQVNALGPVGNPCSAPAKILSPPGWKKAPGGASPGNQPALWSHMRPGDWPAGSVLGFLSGPRLELAGGANPCPCCKWCMSSLGHPPSCLPGISLWYLLPRKKGERWRTMLGQNPYSFGEALEETPAFSTACWGYNRGKEEEHGEKCQVPRGLQKKFKFISAPSTPANQTPHSPIIHLLCPTLQVSALCSEDFILN